jgi:hypothetical protein
MRTTREQFSLPALSDLGTTLTGDTTNKAGRLFVAHASLGHVFVFAPNGECIAPILYAT